MKSKIYKIGRNLGLDKKDIDNVLSASPKQTADAINTPAADVYKSGTKYGTVSPKELYKGGTRYGTISPKDLL